MIRPGLCHSYKREIFRGVHREDHEYYIALYSKGADLSPRTEAYTPAGEVVGPGYPAGGVKLSGFSVSGDEVACLDFDEFVIKRATIAADGALIYNKTAGNRAVVVCKFPQTITSTNGPFSVEMPPVGEATSVIRIA